MSSPEKSQSRRRWSFRTAMGRLHLSWTLWFQTRADRKRLKQEQAEAPLRMLALLEQHLEKVQEIQERHSQFQVELAKRQVAMEERLAQLPAQIPLPPVPPDLSPQLAEQREMLLELLQATHPPVEDQLFQPTGLLMPVSTSPSSET